MGLFTKMVATIARSLRATDPRLVAHFGGGETDAGEAVSVDSAMQVGTVWACVQLIAETIATLPLHVYRRNAEGFGVIDDEHPLAVLLRSRPNADMTAVEFWEASVAHLLLWGNAYWAVARLGARIVALYPMRPDRVSVRRETTGALVYTFTQAGQTKTLPEADVLHIKGFSLDGLMGLSPIAQARNNIGAARAAERASSSIFRNGMRPSGILTAPTYLNAPQREDAKAILASFKGASQTGSTPLLEGDWKWTALTIPPEDAQMLATMGFNVEVMCRWFRVPPIMIGHGTGDTDRGTEQKMLHFYTSCLRAHLTRLETAVRVGLLTAADQTEGVYIKFSVEGLLRADSAGRASFYSTMVQNGLMSRNEARALEQMPPKEGGDDLTVQAALMPIQHLGQSAANAPQLPSPQNGSSTPIPEIRQ